ncbi:hypothetical protein A6X21_16270 [Planctopirus hydrillae]|uniref:Uncharacterized protein n=1 Tax=Planctopirus hydrillae TaxID=1841610 RepID=A0A1C3ESX9_9PLAN|nr:hypothetical protein A6X21_16270 [Planctopirus hydrillae]
MVQNDRLQAYSVSQPRDVILPNSMSVAGVAGDEDLFPKDNRARRTCPRKCDFPQEVFVLTKADGELGLSAHTARSGTAELNPVCGGRWGNGTHECQEEKRAMMTAVNSHFVLQEREIRT